ncbi:MAG: ATP synthase subunit I [Arenimonas sp.]
MQKHLAEGRNLALQVAKWQALTGATAMLMVWFLYGQAAGLGLMAGVLSILLGNLAMAQLSLGGGIQSATRVYSRLWLGLCLKWLIVGLVLILSFRLKALAPLAVAIGVVLALVVFPIVALSSGKVKREH